MTVHWLTLIVLGLRFAAYSPGAILVHLRNGAEFEAKTQSRAGDLIRLSVDHGTIDLAETEIERLEIIPDPPAEKLTSPAPASSSITVAEMLVQASRAAALPSNFVSSVARAESALKPDAVSPKGAMGLMQLMPATAVSLGVNRQVPTENAMGGARYLRELLLRYNGDARLALAAYNAGPGAVDRYHGVPPYPETIAYVNRVLREYAKSQKKLAASGSRDDSSRTGF